MGKKSTQYIYTSPDGGHTVFQQKVGSNKRVKISQDDHAVRVSMYQDEMQLCGVEAIELREKYPALQEAWDRYKTIWHLCVDK
jgi:hypothetical protein